MSKEGQPVMHEPEPIVIRCRENGPLVVQGPFRLVDHMGNVYPLPVDKPFVALCRCGHSGSKPFCDGSHKSCGFTGGPLAPGAE
jgi:CDGSH-type Zn-finger protein